MATHGGLSVISGGQASRSGRYLVAGEGIVISLIGMLQLSEPRGVSLNKLHKTLDRIREGKPRVDWYALRDTLVYLENDGRLISNEVRAPQRWQRGKMFRLYRLADWEEWWRITSRML